MKPSYFGQLFGLAALSGGRMPEVKLSAKDKRKMNDRRPNNPPRSMTPEEKEYYDRNKNLNGFYR